MDIGSEISTGIALYYPYIHPRDINRVNAALIFWDRVRRIVPPSARVGEHARDDDDDARLLADETLLIATPPESYEAAAADRFFQHIGPASHAFTIDLNTARELASRNRGIHIEKIGDQVLWKLQQLGLAHPLGEWVSMHGEVGALYMFCLASEMSDAIEAPLLSDSEYDAEIGQAFLFEPQTGVDVTDTLMRAGIRLSGPAELSAIPTKEVAAFAHRRAAERQRFRIAVQGILEVVRSAADPHVLEDYLDKQRGSRSRRLLAITVERWTTQG